MEALAQLRREGLTVPFVSSGQKTEFYTKIEDRARRLGIDDWVRFLGFVSPLELQCLYRLSRCDQVRGRKLPSVGSIPRRHTGRLLEGHIAARTGGRRRSSLRSRPTGGDREAVPSLRTNEELRHTLVEHAHKNVSQLSWERTARVFQALYRKTGGEKLGVEEHALLAAAEKAL